MKHMLSLADWSSEEILGILRIAKRVKARPEVWRAALSGMTLAMIFEKASTRTRVSFEVGMTQLGGTALYLSKSDLQLGRGETIPDTARVLARYVDAIMARVYSHQSLVELTEGGVPVINGLSDRLHPCQALADMLTIHEHIGRFEGTTLAYVGDGNNTCHSLIHASARLGVHMRIATPEGYEPDAQIVSAARAMGGEIDVLHDPVDAVETADVVYTDVWASMGQEREEAIRNRVFGQYAVDRSLFGKAASHGIFMHCLPAHRGREATDAVVDHERSVVFDQAENRLHAQKALLLHLLVGVPLIRGD